MQEKLLGELIFVRMHAGSVFALARIQEIFLRDHFPHASQILEGLHFLANTCFFLYSHPCEHRNNFLASYLCIGFVPGEAENIHSLHL